MSESITAAADVEAFSREGLTSHTVRRRYTVRRRAVMRPFVWHGLLPLLGLLGLMLVALWPFATESMEATVRSEVRAALDQAGHGWAKLEEVSGQEVTLSGVPPTSKAADQALSVARERRCPTWLGPKVCAVVVNAAFAAPAPPPKPAPAPVASTPAPPTPAPVPPPTPASAAAPAPVAPPAASVAAAQACQKELASLLSAAQVRFGSARADIQPQSHPLLDRLAAAVRKCPASVEIEGHTDNLGSADMNRRLSQARAEAVVDALVKRGIAADRLVARGHGPDQPAADNATAEGRAANRRIEFRALAGR